MTSCGFHCSHEHIAPSRLRADLVRPEQAGFRAAMSSDHVVPWSSRRGHPGLTLAWLGTALARTSLRIGSVDAPGQRYHLALAARATTTLAEMFPDRYGVALGSGAPTEDEARSVAHDDRWRSVGEHVLPAPEEGGA